MKTPETEILLSISEMKKLFSVKLGAFGEKSGVVHAVDGISLDIYKGETLGMVGESGCGKSTTGFSIIQLHRPTSGKVLYKGIDLTSLSDKELRPLRQEIQIVFQDPYSTLNPRMTIGDSIAEPIKSHFNLTKAKVADKVSELLNDVGLDSELAFRYPHEFSGGQRQRICIARALAVNPDFVVCDEPVSALDVSIQAQIINLLQDLQEKYGLTYLFIAHDLAVVRHISDRIVVMYLGKIVEIADKDDLFTSPLHPYTEALLSAVSEADPKLERERHRIILEGDVPSALTPPSGCRFHTRCPKARVICSQSEPELIIGEAGHAVACHFAGNKGA